MNNDIDVFIDFEENEPFQIDIFHDLIQSQDNSQKIVDIFQKYIDNIDHAYVSIVYTISKNPVHVQDIDKIFQICIKHNYTSTAIQHFLDAWIDYWTTEPNNLLNYASPLLFNKFRKMLGDAIYHLRDQEIDRVYHPILKNIFKINLECTG